MYQTKEYMAPGLACVGREVEVSVLYSTVQNWFSTCLPGKNRDEQTDYLCPNF